MAGTVSVVIPNYQGEDVLGPCLTAVLGQTRVPDQVIVVDNGSTDGSRPLLRRDFPAVEVLALARNHGFAGGVNRGLRVARSERVAVLNSDARPEPDWLAELSAAPEPPDVWQWGSVLLSPRDGRVESAGDAYDDQGFAYKLGRGLDPGRLPTEPYPTFAAPGAAPLMRRDVLAELGGYHERYFLYYEDVDLAYRAILRGYRAMMVPSARVWHDLGASGTARRVRYHVARNQVWTAARCIPEPDLRAIARRLREELRYNRPLSAELAGRAAALVGLPRALRERRAIQAGRVRTPAEVREVMRPPRLA